MIERDRAIQQLTTLRDALVSLDKMTPRRPSAITWEAGVSIINHVQDVLLPALTPPAAGGKEEGK